MNKKLIRIPARKGFTLVELLVVIAIIGVLAALLMPALTAAKGRAQRIQCISDLREAGLAFHLFANDHSGKFPMGVSTNDGGSLEFVTAGYQSLPDFYFSYQHFRALAGELSTPALLACPSDAYRRPSTSFNNFSNTNLSYDIGLKADPLQPNMILAADRNYPWSCCWTQTIFPTPVTLPYHGAAWDPSPGLHGTQGNILFSDGRVDESHNVTDKSGLAIIAPAEQIPQEDMVRPEVPATPYGGFQPAQSGSSGGLSTVNPFSAYQNGRTAAANAAGAQARAANSAGPGFSASTATAGNPAGQVGLAAGSSPNSGQPVATAATDTGQPALPPLETPNQPAAPLGTPAKIAPALAAISRAPSAALSTNQITFPPVLAEAAHDSLHATSWLLWILLVLALLILLARWLDRHWQAARLKSGKRPPLDLTN